MTQRYALLFRLIHWAMALIVLTMLAFGQKFAGEMPVAERQFSLMGHSSLGVLLVGLLSLRLIMRLTGMAKRPEHSIAPWQKLASRTVQTGLYALMVLLPITGFLTARVHELPVTPFGLFSISTSDPATFEAIRDWHMLGTKLLMVLLVLHIGAALMHRFVLRDGVMGSMSLFRPKS
ncbi:cytochrome b/b6 domain-containing protein [Aliiroseovarius sp. KMU-50]|uniref:Cytochrome b/b6 domain-containing protein n=1 Tax=Aliiroseovarius salicola TaxID=3009082 RepID=A0ABT4W1C6_9RHOB|nr:cytochrome b/b6 domain-containing protein [Aliiroseovarius sp. KMU-50]MDA5094303.1 cytochrome b/b6 domain-containing protein [Aliiroseovarius sp. KMU-50]